MKPFDNQSSSTQSNNQSSTKRPSPRRPKNTPVFQGRRIDFEPYYDEQHAQQEVESVESETEEDILSLRKGEYEVPFLKGNKVERIWEPYDELRDAKIAVSQESGVDEPSVERQHYEPAFKGKVAEEVPISGKNTPLHAQPSPKKRYNLEEPTLRDLTKRLVKEKEQFLLFEEERHDES